MRRLIPTEKYLDDCAKWVGTDEQSPEFQAHRRLLQGLLNEESPPASARVDPGFRFIRRESIDDEYDLIASVVAAAGNRLELRGLKRVPTGRFLL